jgi:hypothetical protein
MVLGFIVFWPIGLAILGFKVWQRKSGYAGGLAEFVDEKVRGKFVNKFGADWRAQWRGGSMWGCAQRGRDRAQREWSGFAPRSTGNAAFDDWRTAELARIEEERRKLWAAQQEFSEYMDGLKRARDREEFDRFMNHRRSSPPADSTPNQQA